MPGFSSACEAGAHAQCMEAHGQCRCRCHPWTEELYRQGPAEPSGRGGVKRDVRAQVAAAVAKLPAEFRERDSKGRFLSAASPHNSSPPAKAGEKKESAVAPEPEPVAAALRSAGEEAPPAEVYNTCPRCSARAKASDQFCRKDGARLCLGKPCPRCGNACEEPDKFCWACGWNLAEAVPTVETTIHPTLELSLEPEEGNGQPQEPEVDPILRLQQTARERGLLPRETIVG